MLGAGESSATFDIEQGHLIRHADPAGDGRKPVLPGPTSVHSIKAEIFVLQIAPGPVGLDPGDQFAKLIIEPGLAAEQDGIAGLRRRARRKRPVAIGEPGANVTADIETGPVIGRRKFGAPFNKNVASDRCGMRRQNRKYGISDAALTHKRLPTFAKISFYPNRNKEIAIVTADFMCDRCFFATAKLGIGDFGQGLKVMKVSSQRGPTCKNTTTRTSSAELLAVASFWGYASSVPIGTRCPKRSHWNTQYPNTALANPLGRGFLCEGPPIGTLGTAGGTQQ